MPHPERHPALFLTRTGQYTSSVFHTDISHPVPNLSLYFIHISYLCLSDRLRISLKIRRSASAESVSSSITSAVNKSRDEKFCVSQGGKAFVLSVFTACVYCHGLIGRRKILRLYWADAIKCIRKNQGYYKCSTKVETQNLASHKKGTHLFSAYSSHPYIAMDCSGDAKSCVSTWRTPLSILGKIKDIICVQQK
jgi:hypothetical protein